MKKSGMTFWGIVLVAGAAGLGARQWVVKKEKAPSFETVEVRRGALRVTILSTGVVQPQNRLEIKPPIAGRAEKVLAREGMAVRKGQILAWMSSTERAALLDAARAKGPEELAHWEDLYKPTPLIAPLDGVVISRDVEPGQTVTAQDSVLIMSDRLIIKAQVDETDIARVRPGQTAEVMLDAYPEEAVPGRVSHIAFEAKTVNNVTIYEVDVTPERVPSFMRSGMTANINFLVAEKRGVLMLPAEAVREGDEGHSRVLVPNPQGEGRPDRRAVVTGLTDGRKVEIVEGVDEGDKVLIPVVRLPKSSGPQKNPFSPMGGRGRGGGGGERRQR